MSEIVLKFIILSVFLCIPIITVGPAQAGFTYILRNYAREEHAFIWGDFKDNAIKNFKQSLIISIIDFFVAVFMIFAIIIYQQLGKESFIATIGSSFMVLMFIIFMMMHMYMYPILVTFHLSIKQIYKNSLIFAIVKLFPNLGIFLLSVSLIFLTFYFNAIIGLFLYVFITVSLIGLITNFYVYPKLQKYMMRDDETERASDDDEEYEEDEEDEYEEDNALENIDDTADDSQEAESSNDVKADNGEEEMKRFF